MAAINLASEPFAMQSRVHFRLWLEEVTVALLTSPTKLTDEDMSPPGRS